MTQTLAKTDLTLVQPQDVPAAIGLLSRLPVRVNAEAAQARGARAVWAYPLAGVVIGLIAALFGSVLDAIGLPIPLVAAVVLCAMVVLTGAMHEDGLADCADGFWGGWDTNRRLEIMKDSRIGAYGVIALVFSLLMRWTALVAVLQASPIAGPVIVATLSRAAMPVVMWGLPHARAGGLSRAVGRPPGAAVALNLGVAALIGFLLSGWAILPLALIAGLVCLTAGAIARAKIGGQTGDVLGATQQVVEIALLCTLAAMLQ